jgi:hypothetical protein
LYGSSVYSSSNTRLRLLQVIGDSAAAVLVFLVAVELLPFSVAAIAGMLVAFSPHHSYYSLWLTPDSLAALPILIAVYLLIRSMKKPRLVTVIAAGVSVGISCWLRSNSLLLAPFLAVAMLFLFEGRKRLLYSAAFVGAMLIVISPITIRNLVVFGHFIPLSIGAGITMIEGIADYDTEQRFGLPRFDDEVGLKDAEWHNRPDYAGNVWIPDGVERDQARFARGLEVIRSNPGWFLKVVARRAAFMLRYNEEGPSDWPFNTAQVPLVSSEPGFYHQPGGWESMPEAWTATPAEMLAAGTMLSPEAKADIESDNGALRITGDSTVYGDQFIAAPIGVKEHTDYLLSIPIEELEGPMAAKVTTIGRHTALASRVIPDPQLQEQNEKRRRMRAARRGEQVDAIDLEGAAPSRWLEIPFASGDRNQVLLVISNNGTTEAAPFVEMGQPKLVELGPTPYVWTGAPRALVRGIQKNVYVASLMIPLVLAGVVLMLLGRKGRALILLLAVPLYYLLVQSALHTEYRYILAIHYFLFLIAAVTLYCLVLVIAEASRSSIKVIQKASNRRSIGSTH